jgi:hypothetical protein
MRSARLLATVAMALSVAAGSARADDRATATVLFDEAMVLMKAGKFDEACSKLEASERLYQGLGTRANLAECYEKARRFASSWSMYKGALSMAEAKGDARADELRRRVAATEARLSKLTISVAAPKIPGLRVTRDGADLPEAGWGIAVPIDGGRYTFTASAPGFKTWNDEVWVKPENDAVVVTVPPLESLTAPVERPRPPKAAPAEGAGGSTASSSGAGLRLGGLAMVGLGAVGLVGGGIFGLKAMSKKSDADQVCNGGDCHTQQGVDDLNAAIDAAKVSTALVGVGAVFIAGGATLYFFAPRSSVGHSTSALRLRLDADVTRTKTGVSLCGAF